nr:MAG TPA: hypothetical protein [Caudoviricetes sp.]
MYKGGMIMLDFLTNDKVYEIQANGQISMILSQFDSGYIMDIVEDTLRQLFNNFDTIPRPNVVSSFENSFKQLYDTYPNDIDNINSSREEVYRTIIDIICKRYELRFIQSDDIDLFTVSLYYYDFFVARINQYIVQFYAKLLMDEKSDIYMNMNLESLRKNKDVSTVYSNMAFNDDEALATIAANLPIVLKNLASSLQIPDHRVFRYTYGDQPAILNIFDTTLTPVVPLFSRFNSLLFNDILYGPMIIAIRLELQKAIDFNKAMAGVNNTQSAS